MMVGGTIGDYVALLTPHFIIDFSRPTTNSQLGRVTEDNSYQLKYFIEPIRE